MERSSTPRRRARALRRSLALSVAAGLALGAVSSAHATLPGGNGKIAFYAPLQAGANNIWAVNPDGTGLTQLTTDDQRNQAPEWSADGLKIAYHKFSPGRIHVMNADGTGQTPVGPAPGAQGYRPAWSPDGTKIAFDRLTSSGIFVMDADGTDVTQLPGIDPVGYLSHPDWSPDGTKIASAWLAPGGVDRGIVVNDLAAGEATLIKGGPDTTGFYASREWSADGSRIFYQLDTAIWSANPDGTGESQLPAGISAAGYPAPAPDGSRVAFRLATGPLRAVDPDGSNPADVAGPDVVGADWQPIVEPPELAPLEVSKTAEPTYTVRHLWDIDKWASTKAGWDAKDSSLAVRYTVRVRHEVGDAYGIAVSGDIRIHNPNHVAVPLSDVNDSTEGATSCTTGAGPTVPANGTVYVPYTCNFDALPGGVVTNTASVYWNDGQADQVTTAQVPVDFGAARVYNDNAWVKVTDTLDGDKTRTLAKHLDRSRTFTYTGYLKAWPGKCRVWHNTARLIGYEHAGGGPTNGVPIEPQTDLRVRMDGDDYAFTKTAQEWVKVCAPPDPPKDDPTVDPKPPTVIVGGDKPGPQPVRIVEADNPKGPVVKDPSKSRGTLRVHKRSSERRARVGDTVIWSIRVANTGKADLSRVRLLDKLPRHLVVATTGQVSSGRAVKSTKRRIRIAVGDLAVGQKRTYRIATRVVARPKVTPKVVASAKKLNSRARKVLLKRSKRGIVCNKVMANAPDTRAAFSTACVRIVRTPVVVPPPT